MVVLVEYGNNDNRLRVIKKVDWMVGLAHLQNTNFLRLILSPVITVHTLRNNGEIKTVSLLTRRSSSLVL